MVSNVEGAIVEKALEKRADKLPTLAGRRPPRSQRNADALASIAQDSLVGGESRPTAAPIITIFIDGAQAAPSAGERGVDIAAGPRAGSATLERILVREGPK